MIQKAAAMGNWWLAASSWQSTHSCITFMQSFVAKHQITQMTQSPLQPRSGSLQPLAFPKTKITFEKEKMSDCWWDSGKYNGAADGDWENCVRSRGAHFEGDWGVTVLCTMFLVSSSINVYFSQYMAGYFLDRPGTITSYSQFMFWLNLGYWTTDQGGVGQNLGQGRGDICCLYIIFKQGGVLALYREGPFLKAHCV